MRRQRSIKLNLSRENGLVDVLLFVVPTWLKVGRAEHVLNGGLGPELLAARHILPCSAA